MKVILVTGGCGFIGSNFIKYFLRRNKTYIIVNIDKLGYGSNINSLKELEDSPRYHFVKGDICNQDLVNYIIKRYRPDYILNLAAETHEGRSLEHPGIFTHTNIVGTQTLLEGARYIWSKKNYNGNRFIQISTDQVYGENKDNCFFNEEAPLSPTNPYAASKASAEMMAKTYSKAFDMPVIVLRSCSAYGPCQHPENFVPKCITYASEGKPIPLYKGIELTREWIHVLDLSVALIRALFYGRPGETYNIGSGEELTHTELSKKIFTLLNKPENFTEASSPYYHFDKRYGMNSYKAKNDLSWSSKYSLDDGLKDTIRWYLANKNYWES